MPALDAGNEAALHTCGGAVSTKKCCKPALRQALSRRPRAAVTKIVCLLGVVRTRSARGKSARVQQQVSRRCDGSDKSYGFCLPAASRDSTRLEIYEAPIDAMSGASLHLMAKADWQRTHYLAINGLNYMAADRFLDAHPQIKMVRLCLDNDERGRDFAERLAEHLAAHGLTVRITPPALGKDYNDMLLYFAIE